MAPNRLEDFNSRHQPPPQGYMPGEKKLSLEQVADADKLFDRIDHDHDGVITRKEFEDAQRRGIVSREELVRQAASNIASVQSRLNWQTQEYDASPLQDGRMMPAPTHMQNPSFFPPRSPHAVSRPQITTSSILMQRPVASSPNAAIRTYPASTNAVHSSSAGVPITSQASMSFPMSPTNRMRSQSDLSVAGATATQPSEAWWNVRRPGSAMVMSGAPVAAANPY